MDELLGERILRAIEQVPRGRVVSYGDVAALVGTGPRQVGRAMGHLGAPVAWWRVVNHSGDLPAPLLAEALPHWHAEGIGLKPSGTGCRIAQHRADLAAWAAHYERAVADLSPDAPGA